MENLYTSTQLNIGTILKKNRQKKGLSQSDLAKNICSQSLISSIEKGSYMPNALLLFQLCNKLNISIDKVFLKKLPLKDLFQKVDIYCRNQDNQNMERILAKLTVERENFTTEELQMFYFYKVTLQFRKKKQYENLMPSLENVLNLTYFPDKNIITIEERLLLSQLGVFARLKRNITKSKEIFDLSLKNIWNNSIYSEHYNEVFLLYLFTLSLTSSFMDFKKEVERIIFFISSHESHYLLSSIYYLLWQKSIESSKYTYAKKAHDQFITFDELFHEPLLQVDSAKF